MTKGCAPAYGLGSLRSRFLPHDSLRSALRAGTSQTHHQLDMATGQFDSLAAYAGFAQKSHRFRAAVEQALAAGEGWQVDALAPLIALDLADLQVATPARVVFAPGSVSGGARLGICYVLEGSSLGARLLLRRAIALGLGDQFGARHLAHQAGDHDRWRGFVAALDAASPQIAEAAVTAAETTFRFALSVYSEAAHERA